MKRSKFSLSHTKVTTFDMGELVPVACLEVLPGDSIQQSTSSLVRTQPLLTPVMHKVDVFIHHWFVPHRLIWEDWENFITGGPDGMDDSVFPTVAINATNGAVGTLPDYMGIPIPTGTVNVSALPFRAYALIWNQRYRDQDLQTELAIDQGSGPDTTTNLALQFRGWEKDYFTSSRPWTQKGPEVTIPLSGDAPIKGLGRISQSYQTGPSSPVYESDGTSPTYPFFANTGSEALTMRGTAATGGIPDVFADLSNVTAANINDLRLAFALQRYEEARARYGSRYVEYLAYLGVRSSDARLQLPEYLGGGKAPLQISEVLQTGPNSEDEGVADLYGHAIGAVRSNRYRRFFEEHGYVISLMSVMPRTMYVQGIPRTFNRRVKEDFWQKELQHIGQQEVLNKELYVNHTTPDGVFGYQDRYDEYRRMESGVSGEMRTTFDDWHMARLFASDPTLNASFVRSNPTKRIFADQTQDSLWVKVMHSIQARRMVAPSGTSFIF